MSIPTSQFITPAPPHTTFPPWCPYVCSLHLCLYLAGGFLTTSPPGKSSLMTLNTIYMLMTPKFISPAQPFLQNFRFIHSTTYMILPVEMSNKYLKHKMSKTELLLSTLKPALYIPFPISIMATPSFQLLRPKPLMTSLIPFFLSHSISNPSAILLVLPSPLLPTLTAITLV